VRPFLVDNGPDDFQEGLARFQEGGRFGYFDERGRIVIQPQFDFSASFCGGRAAFCFGCLKTMDGEYSRYTGGKWGFIDREGRMVIPAQFDEVRDFQGGAARVRLGSQWITIGTEGAPDESHSVGPTRNKGPGEKGEKDEHP
jgi:hypothetical protein